MRLIETTRIQGPDGDRLLLSDWLKRPECKIESQRVELERLLGETDLRVEFDYYRDLGKPSHQGAIAQQDRQIDWSCKRVERAQSQRRRPVSAGAGAFAEIPGRKLERA